MLPAFAVIGLGADATKALVISQVVLSFALPIPMIALVIFTRSPTLMGEFKNSAFIDVITTGAAAMILILNVVLLWQTFGVPVSMR
jgi:manganese transport protein